MPREETKEADGACRATCAARETVVVLDNSSSLLGAVNVVTCSVASLHAHTREGGDISEMGDVDDADESMESETLEGE